MGEFFFGGVRKGFEEFKEIKGMGEFLSVYQLKRYTKYF
jgi:hypothetical protein